MQSFHWFTAMRFVACIWDVRNKLWTTQTGHLLKSLKTTRNYNQIDDGYIPMNSNENKAVTLYQEDKQNRAKLNIHKFKMLHWIY